MKRTLARKYAKALYLLNKNYMKDFIYLFELFQEYPSFFELLNTPLLVQKDKEELLTKTLGNRLDPLFLRFVSLVLKKGRQSLLREMCDEYELLVTASDNVWKADLITGVPYQPTSKTELIDKIANHYGKKIECTEHVDPQILGGTLLLLGNKQIDWSIRSRMEKLKTHLLELDICR